MSRQLYRDFIWENVLRPAGMEHSGFFAGNDLPANTANGYFEDRNRTNIYQLPIRGGGDGGMYTTTDDLHRFWQSLFDHKIVSKKLLINFLETRWKFDEKRGYGCGIYKRLDNSMFYIVGGDAGVGFDSRYLVDKKITINLLSNITNGENDMRTTILNNLELFKTEDGNR
jgi:CubicO group peptidase (beta-lactamase class C family)